MLTALQRFLASAPAIDDGIVDTEVVRRLCSDPSAWRELRANQGERIEAARILGASSWQDLGINGREFRVAS